MNRNTKLVLVVSLFALVCLAILWGRWLPDNRGQDTSTLHALARLCDDSKDWQRSITLRETAAESAAGSPRAAVILFEIGEIQENRRKDADAARHAYDRALAADEQSIDALRALARLHRARSMGWPGLIDQQPDFCLDRDDLGALPGPFKDYRDEVAERRLRSRFEDRR